MTTPNKKPDSAPNSLRLDAAKLNRFLDERDQASEGGENKPRRDFVRWAFRTASIPFTVVHPGGSNAVMHVACRNLSSGGIGLLHNAYMHTGTHCFVTLTRTDGHRVSVEGTIVRCIHVTGAIHEIGVKFLKPIDAKQFIDLDPFANGFNLETVDPESLRGTVLLIEDSALDQTLIRHYLRETQISLVVVDTVEEGLARAAEGVDMILCDANAGGASGADFVRKARDSGLSQPILMLTADTGESTRRELIKARATAILTKPLKQQTLFQALAEFMSTSADAGGIASTLPANHANLGLLETFVEQTKATAKNIEKAVAENNAARARLLCLQIMGSAPEMGFEKLADLARAAEQVITATKSCADAAVPLRTLIGACLRTSSRQAA